MNVGRLARIKRQIEAGELDLLPGWCPPGSIDAVVERVAQEIGLMTDSGVRRHDVVQIDPADDVFGGCFMLVTGVRSWGVVGEIRVPGQGVAPYRCEYGKLAWVGAAEWVPADTGDSADG